MMQTVADQFERTLATAGISQIHGSLGDSLNGRTYAVRRQGKIEWIHVMQEEAAAFAANAEARLTGELMMRAVLNGQADLIVELGQSDLWR